MIDIDGSFGEGGGQILRTALSMSAVKTVPVRIFNIRAGRPNPGLSPQHVTSIEAVAELAGAEVDGLHQGSKEIVFRPSQLTGGRFEFDVGTAGSISLVVQSCLLPAVMSKSRVEMTVKGGTDVRWSPPIDYMSMVHLPLLRMFGAGCDVEVVNRGFYPEGGGEVKVDASPSGGLRGLDLGSRGDVVRVEGVAFAQNLPEHVVSRMKHSAMKDLIHLRNVKIQPDLRSGHSTGAGIVLAAVCKNTVLGASALGQKGMRSEVLGEQCAADLAESIASGVTVDEHMTDQILPYMALADGASRILTDELSGHARTNIWVLEKFVGKRFIESKRDGLLELGTA